MVQGVKASCLSFFFVLEKLNLLDHFCEEIEIGQVLVKYTLKNILNILLKIFFIIIMHFC
ncbi:hypothetical protein KV47_00450 [Staphylococcus haemolyticus]|uniref:Uncharacterized protein n=2 Tax=Bacillales TaxID=1385 RepID=A0A640MWT0_BACAN|nr:hypothetical protein AV904_04695 [Staphylococcus haemolyticus]OFM08037.1 hypothetical protein HMPREF2722_08345 [Staphylococcus sp. HMSC074A11]OFM09864.1 hypothetical protein HMPREF2720_05620 [Staphylococcus sp. HMSC074C02]OFM10749.1 hypothetical protein HMPREF2717_10085 [Staphylococcus sp. HMSC069D07]OFM36185.1 hypothetical protein HMPREF2695_10460 [Staphylococcus sp. HMSC076E07]OFM40125.1 hypothetical protein HMPREF2694_08875 [Staphylococcus sp. HMSC076B11]OFO70840.1 hypothetical protein 